MFHHHAPVGVFDIFSAQKADQDFAKHYDRPVAMPGVFKNWKLGIGGAGLASPPACAILARKTFQRARFGATVQGASIDSQCVFKSLIRPCALRKASIGVKVIPYPGNWFVLCFRVDSYHESQGVLAVDFTVSAPSTDTNGGHVIDGFDTLTVTKDGSIDTSTGFQHAIHSTGGNNTIVMDGSITTTGGDAAGIVNDASDNAAVTNNGIIETEGDFSNGIMNSDSQYASITNAGSIGTAGELAAGIQDDFSTGSMITNSGTILTMGDFSMAIETVGTSIINSGTMTTEGVGSHGVFIGDTPDMSVHNTGSIRTAGADAIGFVIDGASEATLLNRGLIISEMSDAIRLEFTDTTLNLSSADLIGGRINLVAATTVNLMTEASHSVLWDLSTGSMVGGDPGAITGVVPSFYNASTRQFATFDPSAFVGSLDALGDMTSLLSKVARGGLGTSGFRATGFGGVLDHQGDSVSTLDRKIDQYGFAIGYSAQTDGLEWGVSGGYLMSDLDVDSAWATSQTVEGQGLFAGVNG